MPSTNLPAIDSVPSPKAKPGISSISIPQMPFDNESLMHLSIEWAQKAATVLDVKLLHTG